MRWTSTLGAFHFIRPLWLLLILPGVLFPIVWLRRHDLLRRLDGIIAPHLLRHLVIAPKVEHRVRPVHLLAALLVLGARWPPPGRPGNRTVRPSSTIAHR